jgi:hypothetical protein
MKFLILALTMVFSNLVLAEQVTIRNKNLKGFSFIQKEFRGKGDGSAARNFEWYERATVNLYLKTGATLQIDYSFPGPKTYLGVKSATITNLNLIKSNVVSYEKLGNSIVCYTMIAFVDTEANSLEFQKQVVSCSI